MSRFAVILRGDDKRATTRDRAIAALAWGVLTGALLTLTPWVVIAASYGEPLVGLAMLLALPYWLLVWGVGAMLVGGPVWWLLYQTGVRSTLALVLIAASIAFLITLALLTGGFDLLPSSPGSTYSASDGGGATQTNNRMTEHGWWVATRWAALTAFAGGIVGWVTDWFAFRKPRPVR